MNADVGTKDRSVKRCPVLLNSKLEVSSSWSPRTALNRTGSARRRDGRWELRRTIHGAVCDTLAQAVAEAGRCRPGPRRRIISSRHQVNGRSHHEWQSTAD